MPIKGLSEKHRLPRLGKIHLGIIKQTEDGKEYPSPVDYFVCPPEVQAVYDEKPKVLKVLIPVEDEERWASQYYRYYSQTRGLICKGDGERCMRMVDAQTGDLTNKDSKLVKMKEMACLGRECPYYGPKQCNERMNLQVLLPDVPGLGVWQIDTGSVNSILNINSSAELIRGICGRIAMIPLDLTIEPQVVTPNGKKKTVHVLNLRLNEKLADIQRLAAIPREQVLLPSPDIDVEMPVGDEEISELIIPQTEVEEPPIEEFVEPPERGKLAWEHIGALARKMGYKNWKQILDALKIDETSQWKGSEGEALKVLAELQGVKDWEAL